ncbi:MAG: GNAT family N-acetyltransferase [Methanoculleus sp.]
MELRRSDQGDAAEIEVRLADDRDREMIASLYMAGGWWDGALDPVGLSALIRGSFAFAVAVERDTGRAVGMGRALSDGVSDAYIQDLVVLPAYRGRGIGTKILSTLLDHCRSAGVTWIALVAEPGTETFYTPLGFQRLEAHTPMRWRPMEWGVRRGD